MIRALARAAVKVVAACLSLAVALVAAFELSARLRDPVSLHRLQDISPVVRGDDGQIIHAFLSSDEKWRFETSLAMAPPFYLDLLINYEDRRFYRHFGVDPIAMARAALDLLSNGRIISGASTLTMQTARLLEGQAPGVRGKLAQMVAARRLEIDHDKSEILAAYLTLAPFGGNLEGLSAASRRYFNKPATLLNDREIALQVAIPQAPEARRPDLNLPGALAARGRVLIRAETFGLVSAEAVEDLSNRSLRIADAPQSNGARSAAGELKARRPGAAAWSSLLQAETQERATAILRQALQDQPEQVNAAALIVRNMDGAVIAHVGNARGIDGPAGYLDLTAAIRSPGSALKPVIYGLGFELGLAHPRTKFVDEPVRFGAYGPENFSPQTPSTLTLREALARSLNTAAVALLQEVQPKVMAERLEDYGVDLRLPSAEEPGLSIALGGLGITARDLARIYLALANGGAAGALRLTPDDPGGPRVLLSEGAAWGVTDALTIAAPAEGAVPLKARDGSARIAFKTGTSHGRRDAWAAGYDRDHTIVVWIGRPDGGPTPEMSGRATAVPALLNLFGVLPTPAKGVLGEPPPGTPEIAWTEPPRRLAFLGSSAKESPLRITFPVPSGEITLSSQTAPIPLRASGGARPYTWLVNRLQLEAGSSVTTVGAFKPGPNLLTLVDANGATVAAEIWARE